MHCSPVTCRHDAVASKLVLALCDNFGHRWHRPSFLPRLLAVGCDRLHVLPNQLLHLHPNTLPFLPINRFLTIRRLRPLLNKLFDQGCWLVQLAVALVLPDPIQCLRLPDNLLVQL